MAFRDDRQGQMLLLAGVILVLALISYSLEAQTRTQIGQQTGRELEKPVLDDFILLRRLFAQFAQEELRSATGVVRCPTDLYEYGQRLESTLSLMVTYESERGHLMSATITSITQPIATRVVVAAHLQVADNELSADDDLKVTFDCTV